MTLPRSLELIVRQRRWTPRDAEAVLAAAVHSDLSLRAFAVEHGLDVHRLYRWKKELRRRDAGGIEPVRFEELVVRRGNAENDTTRIEVVLPSGCVVRIGAGFDEATLRRLIAVLEGHSS
jgi:transposase-like protein